MPKLVTKFGYLKPGARRSRGGYVRYIATREGVEKLDASQLMSDLTAKTYADYIATRPGAQRFGTHGLFSDAGKEISLPTVSKELNAYQGNVWTGILSLKREDAARLGYDSGERWRDLLRTEASVLAESLHIPLGHLQWYAAFHNEGHHPHVHMIAYSCVPGEGFLSEKGVNKMRSALANEIFKDELYEIYDRQTAYRDELRQASSDMVSGIVSDIRCDHGEDTALKQQLFELAERLAVLPGKKVYGYLPQDLKQQVDRITDLIGTDRRIAELLDLWYEQREAVLRTYTSELPERVSLSQLDAFRPVRNVIVREAAKLSLELYGENHPSHTRLKPSSGKATADPVTACAVRLLADAARMIGNGIGNSHRIRQTTDRKLRRRLNEKKEAMGMKIELGD